MGKKDFDDFINKQVQKKDAGKQIDWNAKRDEWSAIPGDYKFQNLPASFWKNDSLSFEKCKDKNLFIGSKTSEKYILGQCIQKNGI